MIGRRCRRVTAVVGGDYEQVVDVEPRQKLAEPFVKFLESLGISGDIVAVTVSGVEIH